MRGWRVLEAPTSAYVPPRPQLLRAAPARPPGPLTATPNATRATRCCALPWGLCLTCPPQGAARGGGGGIPHQPGASPPSPGLPDPPHHRGYFLLRSPAFCLEVSIEFRIKLIPTLEYSRRPRESRGRPPGTTTAISGSLHLSAPRGLLGRHMGGARGHGRAQGVTGGLRGHRGHGRAQGGQGTTGGHRGHRGTAVGPHSAQASTHGPRLTPRSRGWAPH